MKKNKIALFLLSTFVGGVCQAYELKSINESPKLEIPINSVLEAKVVEDLIFDKNSPDVTAVITKDFVFNGKLILKKGSKLTGYAEINDNQRIHFKFNTLVLSTGDEYEITAEGKNSSGNDYVKAEYVASKKRGAGIFGRVFRTVVVDTVDETTNGIAGDAANAATDEATDGISDEMKASKSSSYSKLKKNTSITVIVGR